jgi:hypothetical protein
MDPLLRAAMVGEQAACWEELRSGVIRLGTHTDSATWWPVLSEIP